MSLKTGVRDAWLLAATLIEVWFAPVEANLKSNVVEFFRAAMDTFAKFWLTAALLKAQVMVEERSDRDVLVTDVVAKEVVYEGTMNNEAYWLDVEPKEWCPLKGDDFSETVLPCNDVNKTKLRDVEFCLWTTLCVWLKVLLDMMPVAEGVRTEGCDVRELSRNGFREEETTPGESSVWRRLSVTIKVLPKSREGDVDMDKLDWLDMKSPEDGLRSEGCGERVLLWNDANDDKLRAVELTPWRTLCGLLPVLLILVEVNFAVGNTKLDDGGLRNDECDERVLSWNSVSEETFKL